MTNVSAVTATTETPCNLVGVVKKESKSGDEYFQLIFEQEIKRSNQPQSLLAKLNTGDSRFTQAKPRKLWIMAHPTDIERLVGVKQTQLADMELDETLELDIKDFHIDGNKVNIQVQEFRESEIFSSMEKATSDKVKASFNFYLENKEKVAKQLPDSEEYFISADTKELVFMITTLVEGTANHRFLEVIKVAKHEVFAPQRPKKSSGPVLVTDKK